MKETTNSTQERGKEMRIRGKTVKVRLQNSTIGYPCTNSIIQPRSIASYYPETETAFRRHHQKTTQAPDILLKLSTVKIGLILRHGGDIDALNGRRRPTWRGRGSTPKRRSRVRRTRENSAPSRSILFTNAIAGISCF